jgi:RNA-directed DNA polymerase
VERVTLTHTYQSIISTENLLEAWKEFAKGKRNRSDAQMFERNLMTNVFKLHQDLAAQRYMHGLYEAFSISDPRPRNIHKASVKDRVVHRALYRKLYYFFDRIFIPDSYSCRIGRGTHKALNRFTKLSRKVSRNHTKTAWVLKCDIKKFFASINQGILLEIVSKYITEKKIMWLIETVVRSFNAEKDGIGLPLGNLTSQLLVNTYMNEFDRFVKHELKAKYYIRYADDFVLMSSDRAYLQKTLPRIRGFLKEELSLKLHPKKISIQTIASGIDFLGWVHFSNHRVLRTTTKKRMLKAIKGEVKPETLSSYRGLLKHGNARKLEARFEEITSASDSSGRHDHPFPYPNPHEQ